QPRAEPGGMLQARPNDLSRHWAGPGTRARLRPASGRARDHPYGPRAELGILRLERRVENRPVVDVHEGERTQLGHSHVYVRLPLERGLNGGTGVLVLDLRERPCRALTYIGAPVA